MSVSPELKKFVDNGDLVQIRCYLANYLVVDRTFALFDESLAYASAHLPVIQEHDGSALEQNKALWDRDYLNKQMVAAFSNFSKERIAHIKEVVSFVADKSDPLRPTGSRLEFRQTGASKTGRTVVGEEEVSVTRSISAEKGVSSCERGLSAASVSSDRTGRRVIEETEAESKAHKVETVPHRTENRDTGRSSNSNRTGRRVISETETEKQPDEGPVHPDAPGKHDVGTAMIVGGVALTAVGVTVVKPVVIGAGLAVAGLGVAIKLSNNRK